ncbi:transglycosylase family protein, partial [Candidatus Microgenomates bacterium]|nr:transglycosylase family protein [Candidatus Microgenomates bacterium]
MNFLTGNFFTIDQLHLVGNYGAYQFDYSTWQSNAPSSYRDMYPHQAPPN